MHECMGKQIIVHAMHDDLCQCIMVRELLTPSTYQSKSDQESMLADWLSNQLQLLCAAAIPKDLVCDL